MAVITEMEGDVFDSPPNSILIHACNAKGVWGAGVALEFKKRYPHAFRAYKSYCATHSASSLLGTAYIISPSPLNPNSNPTKPNPPHQNQYQHHIACLFTSASYGKKRDSPATILQHTRSALDDLARQVDKLRGHGVEVGECRAVRINSGKFGVDWGESKRVLEEGRVDIVVVKPLGEGSGEGGAGKDEGPGSGKKEGGYGEGDGGSVDNGVECELGGHEDDAGRGRKGKARSNDRNKRAASPIAAPAKRKKR